jgi:triosephosphate isomerase (TIM)
MGEERPRPLVAGNWKMNGLRSSLKLLGDIADGYGPELKARVDLLVCPPATLLYMCAVAAVGTRVHVGGQDAHPESAGAYTGSISPEMLSDLGASHVILGHSERRSYHRESDAEINAKALGARRAGLAAIICVGETREERDAGQALAIVAGQVRGSLPEGATGTDTAIAYEPVWAIGTGLTPTPADVAETHAAIRAELSARLGESEAQRVRILYGGSVKPKNASELMAVPNVDGALVGGASLVAADFLAIAEACR